MSKTTSTLTDAEAEAVIRDRAGSYVDEHGADHTLPEFEPWAEVLSKDVGTELDRGHLADVLFGMEKLQELDNGTHAVLRVSRDGTTDNSAQLRDWETSLLRLAVHRSLHPAHPYTTTVKAA